MWSIGFCSHLKVLSNFSHDELLGEIGANIGISTSLDEITVSLPVPLRRVAIGSRGRGVSNSGRGDDSWNYEKIGLQKSLFFKISVIVMANDFRAYI